MQTAIGVRENTLRAYRFEKPAWIPVFSGIPPMFWLDDRYDPRELEDLLLTHKILFPDYRQGDIDPKHINVLPDMIKGKPWTDGWGCVWETAYTGMVGSVKKHALASWESFDGFNPPNPDCHDGMRPVDWAALLEQTRQAREKGQLVSMGLPHGHSFLRLQDLRGYENLMFDMSDDEPRLHALIKMVEKFNLALVERFLRLEPDIICIPEDLGMQASPMLSPAMFRKYIKPSYEVLTAPIKAQGVLVHEHSDGYILDLINDIIEVGGDILNLQDLVNGIDNIAKTLKGRIAIDLDIDRQSITVSGSSDDIHEHIREIVVKLGEPRGGLSMVYQPWPPTPIENIRAVYDALEKYCHYYA